MSKTLSADAIEIGVRYRATTHCNLSWNDGRSRFRVVCHTPSAPPPSLVAELETLVRNAGFSDPLVTFDGPCRFRLDAR